MIPATQMKIGMYIEFRGELYRIIKLEHITPGRWKGYVQAKLVNVIKGTGTEQRFRSEETVEVVKVEQKEMEYIYNEGDAYYFMDTETYEQLPIQKNFLEDSVYYLLPNIKVDVEFYNDSPIGIKLPKTVDLVITETEPRLKGATVTSSNKPAVTETGLVIQVPSFVEVGDKVRIETSENKYIERAK